MAERLPIYDLETELVARLKTGHRLILSSPTGSGKSTQVPQMLLKHGFLERGQVVILQPRRLATRLLTIGVLVLWVVALPFLIYAAIDFVASARRSAERDEQRRVQQQAVPNSQAPATIPPKP